MFLGKRPALSDTNIDSVLALPIPLRTLILSKLSVLFIVEVAPYCGSAASYDGAVWPDRRYGISVLSNCA